MLAHVFPVLHPGRLGEERTSQRAPVLEALGRAESDHMCFHAFPTDNQPVLGWIFDHALQAHGMAAGRGAEMWGGGSNGGLEFGGARRVDCDAGNFCDHGKAMA